MEERVANLSLLWPRALGPARLSPSTTASHFLEKNAARWRPVTAVCNKAACRRDSSARRLARMVRISVLGDALKTMYNAEKRGKRQVLIRPSSKVVIKFLQVMMKKGRFQGRNLASNMSMAIAFKDSALLLSDAIQTYRLVTVVFLAQLSPSSLLEYECALANRNNELPSHAQIAALMRWVTAACAGYIGEFEFVDDHRGGKIVVELNGR